jgi:hypothetical protein
MALSPLFDPNDQLMGIINVRRGGQEGFFWPRPAKNSIPLPPGKFCPPLEERSADAHDEYDVKKMS